MRNYPEFSQGVFEGYIEGVQNHISVFREEDLSDDESMTHAEELCETLSKNCDPITDYLPPKPLNMIRKLILKQDEKSILAARDVVDAETINAVITNDQDRLKCL